MVLICKEIFYPSINKLLMKHLIITLLTMLSVINANCQAIEVDKSIVIGGYNQSYFYSDYVNCFRITASRDPISILVFKSTQGKLENIDTGRVNGALKLSGLKNGKVTIQVFKKTGTRMEFMNYKEFDVVPMPLSEEEKKVAKLPIKPEIDIEGFGRDYNDCRLRTVPLSVITKAKKFNVIGPYKISEVIVIPTYPNTYSCQPAMISLKSEYFDDFLLRIFSYAQKGLTVTLMNIKIKDSKGIEYSLNDAWFRVTDN